MSEKAIDGIKSARNNRDNRPDRGNKEKHSIKAVTEAILWKALGGPATREGLKPLWDEPQDKKIEPIESD